jgi:RNA polymerase sigma factor (sigma-70 family)
MGQRSDEELLAAMSVGRADAFEAFYERHLPHVTGFFLRRLGERELAFDLVAETFAAVVVSSPTFDADRGSGAGWLFGIAANKLRESARRGRVEARAREQLALNPIAVTAEDLERVEELASLTGEAWLGTLLEGLSDEQREAIWSRVVDEDPYEEIARRMQCSEAVVRQRVRRGLHGSDTHFRSVHECSRGSASAVVRRRCHSRQADSCSGVALGSSSSRLASTAARRCRALGAGGDRRGGAAAIPDG